MKNLRKVIIDILCCSLLGVSLIFAVMFGINAKESSSMQFNSWRMYVDKGMHYVDVKSAENINIDSVSVSINSDYYEGDNYIESSFKCDVEYVEKQVQQEYVYTFKLKENYIDVVSVYIENIDGREILLSEDDNVDDFGFYLSMSLVFSFVSLILIVVLIMRVIRSKKNSISKQKTTTEKVKSNSKYIVCKFCGSENEPNARKCESCKASLKDSRE